MKETIEDPKGPVKKTKPVEPSPPSSDDDENQPPPSSDQRKKKKPKVNKSPPIQRIRDMESNPNLPETEDESYTANEEPW